MKKEEIVIGQTYRVRLWDDMAKECGVSRCGDIKDPDGVADFIKDMADLCGKPYTVTDIKTMDSPCGAYEMRPFMLEPIAGMYMVGTPGFPSVTIGNFTICRQDDKSVWMCCADGEGMQVADKVFEPMLAEFYTKHF